MQVLLKRNKHISFITTACVLPLGTGIDFCVVVYLNGKKKKKKS